MSEGIVISNDAKTIIDTLQLVSTAKMLPEIVLSVMKEIERKFPQDAAGKCKLAIEVVTHVLPASDRELVNNLIASFVQVSKDPSIIQAINLVKQAAERIEDETSTASATATADAIKKGCCTVM